MTPKWTVPPMDLECCTPKESHAEAIRFLDEALTALDQAVSCLRDAKTYNSVQTMHLYPHSSSKVAGFVLDLLETARDARCEDCDELIAVCRCAWSNHKNVCP